MKDNSVVNFLKRIFLNRDFFILIFFIIIGFGIRAYKLSDANIFAYDQARDGQRIFEMLYNHDIKLVGPETDIRGIFNGPLLYYLLLIPYGISHFNPNVASLMFIFINLSGVFLLYAVSRILFKNNVIGLIAGFLWAISYEQGNFAKFISNASLMSIATLIFFTGLAMFFLQKNRWGLIISAFGLGCATHFNVYLLYLGIVYVILYFVYKPQLNIKFVLASLLTLFLLLSPFLIAELKWNFLGLNAAFSYISNPSENSTIIKSFDSYLTRFSEAIYFSFISINTFIALLSFIFFFIIVIKDKQVKQNMTFLLIWLFSTLPLFGFHSGVLNGQVINSSIFAPLTIIMAAGVAILLQNKRTMLIGIVFLLSMCLSNFYLSKKENFNNVKIFSLQPLYYADQKALIDYTYQKANGKDFSICAVTNPLFINTLWSYDYYIYGNQKYKYLPSWSGQKQEFIKSLLPYDTKHNSMKFLIIEPGELLQNAIRTTIYFADLKSSLRDERKFGSVIVQEREMTTNKKLLRDTQNLTPYDKKFAEDTISKDPRYSCFVDY